MVLYVRLDDDALQHLRELAKRERRRPRDQAAILLERVLAEAVASEQGKPSRQLVAAA